MFKPKPLKIFLAFLLLAVIAFLLFRSSVDNQNFGVDSNNNGIWDDVDAYIQKTATTEKQKLALEYSFREMQKRILEPSIGKMEKEKGTAFDEDAKASACCRKVYAGLGLRYKAAELRDVIVNSRKRAQGWFEYNTFRSGGVYQLWNEEKMGDPCPF